MNPDRRLWQMILLGLSPVVGAYMRLHHLLYFQALVNAVALGLLLYLTPVARIGTLTIMLGCVSNFVAILANGGRMPVNVSEPLNSPTWCGLSECYHLPALGDWIPISDGLFAPGDIMILLGAFLILGALAWHGFRGQKAS